MFSASIRGMPYCYLALLCLSTPTPLSRLLFYLGISHYPRCSAARLLRLNILKLGGPWQFLARLLLYKCDGFLPATERSNIWSIISIIF